MAHKCPIVSEQFPELFHYTTVSALESIYEKKQFWATHYEDMNDRTEFNRFRLKVSEFIHPRIWEMFDKKVHESAENAMRVERDGGIDIVVDKETEMLLDMVHSHTFDKDMYKETFVSSFCAHKIRSYEASHGLLSQWRGYGADGGIAIVLDTLSVEERMKQECNAYQLQIMLMGDVIYDDDSNDARIKKDFKNVFENFPKILEKPLASCFAAMHDDFLKGSVLVKHHAFHEESEIRMVVSPTTKDSYAYNPDDQKQQKEILYRQKGNGKVRYIELLGDVLQSIKRIIVGPSRIQNSNCQRIREIVKGSSVEVVRSETPFLGL